MNYLKLALLLLVTPFYETVFSQHFGVIADKEGFTFFPPKKKG